LAPFLLPVFCSSLLVAGQHAISLLACRFCLRFV
jgi:hypothetical protein